MTNLAGRRMMAEIDGDFVVFLIGARFNSFHLLKTVLALGGRRGMKHMLDYLVAHPEKGLLGYQLAQAAILTTEGVARRVVAVGDAIAIHHTCVLGLSYDHRALDGVVAAQFLAYVRDALQTRDWEAELG